jgi:hypothetical protein
VGPAEPELDGGPELVEIFVRHRHGEGHGESEVGAGAEAGFAGGAKIGAPEGVLPAFAWTVELEVELELAAAGDASEFGGESGFAGDAEAVGVEQDVVDAWMVHGPGQEFKEPGVQGGFPAGKLEDFDPAFSIDHALDAPLEILEGRGIDPGAGADGGIGVAGWAGEVAGMDHLDEAEAGGQRFAGGIGTGDGVASQRSGDGSIAGAAGGSRAAAAGSGGFPGAFGEPVEAGVGGDAGGGFAVGGAMPAKIDPAVAGSGPEDFGRDGGAADGAPAGGAFEQGGGRAGRRWGKPGDGDHGWRRRRVRFWAGRP